MYELVIANKNYSSWSLRPWILLTELEIPFVERLIPFPDSETTRSTNSPTFRELSPSGLVPCLIDGERKVWESLAIAEYLAERHAGVWPTDGDARPWARCAASEMHAGFQALRSVCSMNVGIRVKLHNVSSALAKNIARFDQLWCEGLDRFGGPFLAGPDFGAVDAFYAPVAFRVRGYGLELSETSRAYADRLLALPSMVAWEHAALAEAWRDEAHEEESRAVGEWLEDRRVGASS